MKHTFIRRVVVTACAIALGSTALVACSAPGDDGDGAKELTVWGWEGSMSLLQPAADAYMAENPDITVSLVDVGNPAIWQKITTGLAAGGQGLPDIMNTSIDYLPGYTDKFPTGFVDLATLGANDVEGDFAPVAWGGGLGTDGQVWGLPFEVNTAGFVYRSDLFEEAGIDMATIKTWDDLIAAGKILKDKTGADLLELNKAAVNSNAADLWQTLTQQQGAFYFNADGDITMNGPEGVKSLTLIKEMNDAGILADSASFTGGNLAQYADGSVAVNADASWVAGYLQGTLPDMGGQWAAAKRPSVTSEGSTAALAGATYLSISNASKSQEAAWDFVKFALATSDGQEAMQTARPFTPGFVPIYATEAFTNEDLYWTGDTPSLTFVSSITEPGLAASTYTSDYSRAVKILTDAQVRVLLNGMDPQESLDQAAQTLADETGRKIAGN